MPTVLIVAVPWANRKAPEPPVIGKRREGWTKEKTPRMERVPLWRFTVKTDRKE